MLLQRLRKTFTRREWTKTDKRHVFVKVHLLEGGLDSLPGSRPS